MQNQGNLPTFIIYIGLLARLPVALPSEYSLWLTDISSSSLVALMATLGIRNEGTNLFFAWSQIMCKLK